MPEREAVRRRTARCRSPSAAPRSTSTASRSARGSRTFRPSPSRSAAARPTSPSARRGSGSVGRHHRRRRRADGPLHPGAARAAKASRPPASRPIRQRLTALVLLSVENDTTFPLIFYRENCADMALDEADIDEAFIASAQRRARHRHALLQPEHRRRAAQGHAHRARRRAARSSSTSTTGRTSGASPGTPPARSATSSPTGSRSICRPCCRTAT